MTDHLQSSPWLDALDRAEKLIAVKNAENERLRQQRDELLTIVENEPEPPGEMPDELYSVPLEDALRATIRATKKSILRRMRAAIKLVEEEHERFL